MNKLKLAICGIGLVGKRHAEAIKSVENVDLIAIIDPTEVGEQYAHQQGFAYYEQLSALLKDTVMLDMLDGMIISSPTPLHVSQGLLCVEHRLPILIEKPLADTVASGKKLVDAAKQANVLILVGHHRRHNPLIQKAKELIESDAIGEVRAVQAQCWFYKPDDYFDGSPWRKETGAGPISVNLVHDVDLMRYLCGEITQVRAQALPSVRGYQNEDVASALVSFAGGKSIGTITVSDSIVSPWSWEHTAGEYPIYPITDQSCYVIGGSHGSLSLPDLRVWTHQHGVQDWWSPISSTSMIRDSADPLVNQIAHFADVIAGKERPLVSGAEGLKSLQVIEAIQTAAQSGQAVDLQCWH